MIHRHRSIPRGAKLDLGCGARKYSPEFLGVDRLDEPGVDIVGDVSEVLAEIGDGLISEIYTSHFLEHLDDPVPVLREISRVLKPGGRCTIRVPHFSNPYYYSDMTHRTPWGLYSMSYFLAESPFKRAVPSYQAPLPLELRAVRLGFKAAPPFYGRYVLKRLVEQLVNVHRAAQEFYEENLTWLIPCYELRFDLERHR